MQTNMEYAQQQYLLAEQGLMQAQNDGANYWYIDGSFSEEYPENWPDKRIALLSDKINFYNIKPIFHGNFKLPVASDVLKIRNSAIEKVLSEVDLSAELKAPLIVHGGAIVEPRLVIKAKKQALDNYLLSLEKIVSYAEKKNVTILLENLSNYKNYRPFHYIFTTADEYRYIFDRIDSKNVHFFFDVGHGAICEGEPVSIIQEFHEKIWGMSLSNNDGIRDLHLGIYQGIINYQDVINTIVQTNWKGVIAFEIRGKSFAQCIDDINKLFKNIHLTKCA